MGVFVGIGVMGVVMSVVKKLFVSEYVLGWGRGMKEY